MLTMRSRSAVSVMCLLAVAGAAGAQGQAVRVVTDASGTRVADSPRAPWALPTGEAPRAVLWTFNHPTAIAEAVSLSAASGSAWVGQHLNFERLQRFPILGPNVPTFESLGGSDSPTRVSAASGADIAVYIDKPNAPEPGMIMQARAYSSAGGAPLWTREFPDHYASSQGVKVSRDGSTVAVILTNTVSPAASVVYFLEGATGATRNIWSGETGTVGVNGVDLTDNGSLALLIHTTNQAFARLVNTATVGEVFSVAGTGSGGRFQISGDGSVLVVGGFSLHVYRLIGGTYTRVINFTAPTSWFGWGSAVSRDGSTVAVMSHNYGASYLQTSTRAWDMASTTLLGTHNTSGGGTMQDSIVGAALSDNGSRLAVASWGTQDNAHPEVMVFDRTVALVDQLDTPGSPFSLDMTGDGRYVLVGSKSVHANTFGNGGNTYVLDAGPVGGGCYANCDGSTQAPVLNVADFGCFLTRYAAGEAYANCDESTQAPVLNVADFGCYLTKYAAGCR